MQIDYTALRSVKSGHSASTSYTINVDLTQADRSAVSTGAQLASLNDNVVTTVHNLGTTYSVSTVLLTSSTTPSILDMREFLDSVKAGETFTTDITGTTASFRLKNFSSPYTEARTDQAYFRYSWVMTEL